MATYQNETNYYITYSRYNRAFTHRLFLVSTNIYHDKIAFDVMGTTGNVYNLESYLKGNPIQIGRLIIEGTGKKQTYRLEFI